MALKVESTLIEARYPYTLIPIFDLLLSYQLLNYESRVLNGFVLWTSSPTIDSVRILLSISNPYLGKSLISLELVSTILASTVTLLPINYLTIGLNTLNSSSEVTPETLSMKRVSILFCAPSYFAADLDTPLSMLK